MTLYLDHFGLAEPPFRITPHTEFFFDGANRGATLDALIYAITHDEGIVKVSGEVGSGKTMLCRVLMERLPDHVTIIYLANPSLSREDILYAIADDLRLAVPENARASAVLRALQEHLINAYSEGRQVIVLIDEAHAMPAETLEEIRLLSNLESNHRKLLQLVLFGQPELNGVLARPDMRQLKDRITHNFMLEPLVREDIATYIDFRMRTAGYKGPTLFSQAAVKMIAATSLGLTRRINILADKALLAAFSTGSHQVGTAEIQAAIKDTDFSEAPYVRTSSTRIPVYAVGGLALLALLATTWTMMPRPQSASASSAGTSTPAADSGTATASPSASAHASIPGASSKHPAHPASASPQEKQLQDQLESGRQWIANTPKSRWFLQLFGADGDKPELVEAYLTEAKAAGLDMAAVRVYLSDRSGRLRYGVIYGEYSSLEEAQLAGSALPQAIRAGRPYPRQVKRLRQP